MSEKRPVETWDDVVSMSSTEEIQIPSDPLDRVLGQEEAIELAKIAARQRRHLLLVGYMCCHILLKPPFELRQVSGQHA